MKHPLLLVVITLLVTFGSFAVAQEDRGTSSQQSVRQKKVGLPGQGQGSGMQYKIKRNMMDLSMMGQRNVVVCSGCMINRVLMVSSNFYLDMIKSLGLTDAQVDKLQRIRLNHTKQTRDLHGELDIAQLELKDMLESDAININDADWKIGDTYDLEAELQKIKVKSMIKARNVLTPSQREQIKSLIRRNMMMPVMGGGQ